MINRAFESALALVFNGRLGYGYPAMNILLTNDDGIFAPGLLALYTTLSDRHQIYVVAPESEQSAVGHSITLADPIRVKEVKRNGTAFGLALTGTPADCVRIGAGELMPVSPDLVVSGINRGANVGINILYSGTVSAATEAAILGIPAVAVSLNTYTDPDFSNAAKFTQKLVDTIPELNLESGTSLNVNVPNLSEQKIKGVRIAPQFLLPSGETFERRQDPRGNVYYWRGAEIPPENPAPDSDFALLHQGYITVTPLKHDMTHTKELNRLLNTHIDWYSP
jgi:5'-nucleotidase